MEPSKTMLNEIQSFFMWFANWNSSNYIGYSLTYVSIIVGILMVVLDNLSKDKCEYNTRDYKIMANTFKKRKLHRIQTLFFLLMSLIFLALIGELFKQFQIFYGIINFVYVVVSFFAICKTLALPLDIIREVKKRI